MSLRTTIQGHMKNMADRRIRNPYFGYLTAVPSHIRLMQATNDSTSVKSAR